MNRNDRRKAQKRGITAKDLRSESMKAIEYATRSYSVAVAMVLFDKLGFGKKKIQMTMKQIHDLFDAINDGYVDIKDLKKTLDEECDLVFEEGGGSHG